MAKKKVQQPQNDITEFFDALAAYAAEKGIDKDVFAEKIKSAIEKSLKTSMHVEDKDSECVFVNIDFDRKIFNVSVLKEVIEVVDVAGGLVRNHQLGGVGQGAGHSHTLLLTAGELFGLGLIFACQSHSCQNRRNISADLTDGSLYDTLCECYIFINITVIQQSEILEHHAQVTTKTGNLSVL